MVLAPDRSSKFAAISSFNFTWTRVAGPGRRLEQTQLPTDGGKYNTDLIVPPDYKSRERFTSEPGRVAAY
jgi:hypothetical protein